MNAESTLYTLTEVAEILKLNVRSVRRMIKPQVAEDGTETPPILQASDISTGSERGIWRVSKASLDAFMKNRSNGAEPKSRASKARGKKS